MILSRNSKDIVKYKTQDVNSHTEKLYQSIKVENFFQGALLLFKGFLLIL